MPRVVHVVTTSSFAGVERYVADTAVETAARGWETSVVGGDPELMPDALGPTVRWLPGATAREAWLSLTRFRAQDICHAHMTTAEIVAISARVFHRAPIVSTRHFAARRGSRRAGRLVAPWVARRLARQIAVSEFVARHLEKPPDVVIRNGIRASAHLWRAESRVVLVLQRLEREKETLTALRAWRASRLWEDGWSMRVAGEGSERRALEAWVAGEEVPQIEFTGWAANTPDELVRAGILLAPGSSDSFGLAVVEAMAAGVPVVACAGGGHLETVALLPDARLFQPGDAEGAAAALRSLVPDEERTTVSEAGTRLAAETFALGGHIDQLLREYEVVRSRRTDRRARTSIGTATGDDGRSHP